MKDPSLYLLVLFLPQQPVDVPYVCIHGMILEKSLINSVGLGLNSRRLLYLRVSANLL